MGYSAERVKRILRRAGVDRAVFFVNATLAARMMTGPVSLALALRYLTPEIQGYFATFSGIMALQTFLEMGFSMNILQFTSHEFARLRFGADKALEGDARSLSRLTSLARLAYKYYAVGAFLLVTVIGVCGHLFFTWASHDVSLHWGGRALFTIHGQPDHGIPWRVPWWTVVSSTAVLLALNPSWALLEGCNQVAEVAKFRLWSSLACFAVNALAVTNGAGIYTTAIISVFYMGITIGYLLVRWRGFFRQFLRPPQGERISWWREIWPFQWRIAVSYVSNFFIYDIIGPIAFYFCGPAAAGRLSMSIQIMQVSSKVGTSWMATKVPVYGSLVARRDWPRFDALWRQNTWRALGVCVVAFGGLLGAMPFFLHWFPRLSLRFVSHGAMAFVCLSMLAQVAFYCLAMKLRAFKKEPFMWLSVAMAVLSLLLLPPMAYLWGLTGLSAGYALPMWLILWPAWRIYRKKQREYRLAVEAQHAPSPQAQVGELVAAMELPIPTQPESPGA